MPSGGCLFQFGFLENESEFVLYPHGMCLSVAGLDDAGNWAVEIPAASAACLVSRITRHLHPPHLHPVWLALEHRATTPDRSEPWIDGYSRMHRSAGRFDDRRRPHVASAQRGQSVRSHGSLAGNRACDACPDVARAAKISTVSFASWALSVGTWIPQFCQEGRSRELCRQTRRSGPKEDSRSWSRKTWWPRLPLP